MLIHTDDSQLNVIVKNIARFHRIFCLYFWERKKHLIHLQMPISCGNVKTEKTSLNDTLHLISNLFTFSR